MATRFQIGEWLADPSTCVMSMGDSFVKITPRAMNVLVHLAERPGEVVPIEELLEAYWPHTVRSPNVVHKVINELRNALDDDPDRPRYLDTVTKRGYRLLSGVQRIDHFGNGSNGVALVQASVPVVEPAAAKTRLRNPRIMAVLAVGTLALCLATWWIWWHAPVAQVVTLNGRSAVLLPATGRTRTDSERRLLETVLERAAARLRATASLQARNRPFHSLRRVDASGWNADYAVDVDAVEVGEKLRGSLAITPAAPGGISHREQFEVTGADVVAFTDQMVSHVADDLLVLLDATKVAQMHTWGTSNPDAYRYAQQGNSFQRINTTDSQMQAAERFRRSIEVDPNFGFGYLSLVSVYSTLVGDAPSAEAGEEYRRQIEAVFRAASLAHIDPEAMALVEDTYRVTSVSSPFDAEKYWYDKVAKNPRRFNALASYGGLLLGAKLIDESQRYLELAISLPESEAVGARPFLRTYNMAFAYARGDFDESARLGKEIMNTMPDLQTALVGLTVSLAKLGRYEEAAVYLNRLEQSDPVWGFNTKAMVMALHGDTPLGSVALKTSLSNPLMRNSSRGEVCFILGDVECGAGYWKTMEPNVLSRIWVLLPGMEQRWAPNVVPDKRYQALLEKIGLGRTWRAYIRSRAHELTSITGIEVTTPPPPEDGAPS